MRKGNHWLIYNDKRSASFEGQINIVWQSFFKFADNLMSSIKYTCKLQLYLMILSIRL